jgi:hypothetical protein
METEHFLVYSDCPRTQAAAWAMQLEKTYATLDSVLVRATRRGANIQETSLAPWGKIVVYVFAEQDRFRLFEAEAFKQLVPLATVGIAHMAGPKAFVSLHRSEDMELFQWVMIHETVHALMHGFRTPRRLPAWANEGLADYVTSLVLKDSTVGSQRRKAGLEFLRSGRDALKILSSGYADSDWSGTEGASLPVASLLVELLFREQPAQMMQWIHMVKTGEEWQTAFGKAFRMKLEEFAATSTGYYKVND